MKRCPECRRDYYDDTLLYCLEDGTALIQGSVPEPIGETDEPATAILHNTDAPSEAPTRAQIHTTEQTAILPNLNHSTATTAGSKRNSLIAGALGIILVTALGVGSYLMYGRSSTKQIDSIAVMPFVNDSGNPDVEYISDGITETLISSLSNIPNLSVKARSTVFFYKGKNVSPKQIGEELGVQAILLGRCVQRGDDLKLSLELVNTQTQDVVWSDQFDRKMSDLVSVQSEIAKQVAAKITSKLSGDDQRRVAKTYTDNPEAYQAYLKGRFYWNQRTGDGFKKGIEYFQKAIQMDPS